MKRKLILFCCITVCFAMIFATGLAALSADNPALGNGDKDRETAAPTTTTTASIDTTTEITTKVTTVVTTESTATAIEQAVPPAADSAVGGDGATADSGDTVGEGEDSTPIDNSESNVEDETPIEGEPSAEGEAPGEDKLPVIDKKFVKWLLIIVAAIVAVSIIIIIVAIVYVKKFKPESTPTTVGIAASCKKITLQATSGALAGKSFVFLNSVSIGKNSALCELVLPMDSKNVGAVHCKLYFMPDSNALRIVDCGSGGTYLENGTQLEAGKEYSLISGSKFFIGNSANTFSVYF